MRTPVVYVIKSENHFKIFQNKIDVEKWLDENNTFFEFPEFYEEEVICKDDVLKCERYRDILYQGQNETFSATELKFINQCVAWNKSEYERLNVTMPYDTPKTREAYKDQLKKFTQLINKIKTLIREKGDYIMITGENK